MSPDRRPRSCEACRFDGAQYDVSDALGTLRAVGPMWRRARRRRARRVLAARPDAGVWSAVEYAAHSADVDRDRWAGSSTPSPRSTRTSRSTTPARRRSPDVCRGRVAVDRPPRGQPRSPRPPGRASSAPTTPRGGSARCASGTTPSTPPGSSATRSTTSPTTSATSGRGLHLLGAGAPTPGGRGRAAERSATAACPKRAVKVAEVGDRGLVGDRQADRRNHGRPLQALCLWSTEVIEALQAEGHPIEPGAAGENMTISGIDWPTLRTGVQLLIGDVLAEVSAYATPCAKNAAVVRRPRLPPHGPRPPPRLEPRLRLGPRARHHPPRRPGRRRAVSARAPPRRARARGGHGRTEPSWASRHGCGRARQSAR